MSVTLAADPGFDHFDPIGALGRLSPNADWLGLRFVEEHTHRRAVRNGRPEQNAATFERGVMIEALVDGHIAYAAPAT